MHKIGLGICCSVAVAIFLLALGGCSSDSSSPQVDPQKAKERVSQGNQIFIPKLALIIVSGGRDTSAYEMSGAKSLYGEALAADPGNLDAHFGYAATEVLLLNKDPEVRTLFGGMIDPLVPALPVTSVLKDAPSARQVLTSVMGQKILSFASGPMPQSPGDLYGGLQKAGSIVPFSHYQTILETRVLPVLSDAIGHFKIITQNPDYAFYINEQELGSTLNDSIRIDLTEIYLLLAITQAIDAEASFLVAYNVDYNSADGVAVGQAWQLNSPFLALRTGGAQRMKDTKSNFIGFATSLQNGITFLLGETPHPGIDLITAGPQDVQRLNSLIDTLNVVKSLVTEPLHLSGDLNHDGSVDNLTVSLSNFFDNAVTNFKAKLPPYTVGVQQNYNGTYSAVLTWQAASFSSWVFPDATFNGLFPGMTDASFKQTFGLATVWSQHLVIGG